MTPKQAIAAFKGQAPLGRALGVERQVVNNWKKRGRIPLNYQLRLIQMNTDWGITTRSYMRKGNGNG